MWLLWSCPRDDTPVLHHTPGCRHKHRLDPRRVREIRQIQITVPAMIPIQDAGRGTLLYMHTLASALAAASDKTAVLLDLAGVREPSPAAQKAAVAARLDSAVAQLDASIRSKKVPPARIPRATQGRLMIQDGEVYDAVARTYQPGFPFATFVAAFISGSRG